MDYKDRVPNISFWRDAHLDSRKRVFPFDGPNFSTIYEYYPPDFSTCFLSISGGGDEPIVGDLSTIRYLIEAPKTCKMRKAFEIGELSWEDFWHHKGWLIEMTMTSLFAEGHHVRYVHPSQMSKFAKRVIAEFSDKSPLQHKYEGLCWMASLKDEGHEYEDCRDAMLRDYGRLLKAA